MSFMRHTWLSSRFYLFSFAVAAAAVICMFVFWFIGNAFKLNAVVIAIYMGKWWIFYCVETFVCKMGDLAESFEAFIARK